MKYLLFLALFFGRPVWLLIWLFYYGTKTVVFFKRQYEEYEEIYEGGSDEDTEEISTNT